MTSKNSAPLASYIDLLLDVVCAVDSQGRFVFVSASCEQVFGYTPDELIGQPMIEMVHPADRQRTLDAAGARPREVARHAAHAGVVVRLDHDLVVGADELEHGVDRADVLGMGLREREPQQGGNEQGAHGGVLKK